MSIATEATPPRSFWIISTVGLLWNLMGVATYLMTVTISADQLGSMTDAERALYTDIPAWVTSAYAIAVFGGTLGCVALLLRKAWAMPALIASLVAVLIQTGHGFFMTDALKVQGASAAVLPIAIIGVGIFLIAFARRAASRGWIR